MRQLTKETFESLSEDYYLYDKETEEDMNVYVLAMDDGTVYVNYKFFAVVG